MATATKDVRSTIVKLRDKEGLPWEEVASKVGLHVGTARLYYMEVKSGAPVEANAKAVLKARDDEKLSWGAIQARFRISKARALKLYAEAGGDASNSYIGKGGRYLPQHRNGDSPAPTKSKKKGGVDPAALSSLSLDELKSTLEGKKVTVKMSAKMGGGEKTHLVGTVTKVGKTASGKGLSFTDKEGKIRAISFKAITKVR